MRREKGFTLIEIVVVLAIIATIAAFITPMLLDYLKEAKLNKAKADVQAIAASIANFNRDTGVFPIYINDVKKAQIGILLLKSEGNEAAIKALTTGWDEATQIDNLEDPLSKELMRDGTTTYTSKLGSGRAWKGPYLSSFKSDPWGNKYYVACDGMNPDAPTAAAFVISAGPNGELETNRSQATNLFTVGGDDIIYRIK